MTNIAIFVSGNGTNCENIIRHFQQHDDIRVSLVLSNRTDAYALVRAENLGVPTIVMPKTEFNDESILMDVMHQYSIDFIVLAGFLPFIPGFLTAAYERRMLNIHPSLLPKYGGKGMYGQHVHEAVRAANETETGITIHYVSNVCDGGEIIFQATIPVLADDTPDDIATNIHKLERQHYPRIIENVISGKL